MHYGHNNKRVSLYIDGEQLAESENERGLGVIFTTKLKWKNQVITATKKLIKSKIHSLALTVIYLELYI